MIENIDLNYNNILLPNNENDRVNLTNFRVGKDYEKSCSWVGRRSLYVIIGLLILPLFSSNVRSAIFTGKTKHTKYIIIDLNDAETANKVNDFYTRNFSTANKNLKLSYLYFQTKQTELNNKNKIGIEELDLLLSTVESMPDRQETRRFANKINHIFKNYFKEYGSYKNSYVDNVLTNRNAIERYFVNNPLITDNYNDIKEYLSALKVTNQAKAKVLAKEALNQFKTSMLLSENEKNFKQWAMDFQK